MPRARKTSTGTIYTITVDGKPDFCGVGACGVQFAHGEAETANKRAADWHREHEGYTVTENASGATE